MSDGAERSIRVLLVDDHAVVRKGLRALIDRDPGIEVVGQAALYALREGPASLDDADLSRPSDRAARRGTPGRTRV